MGSTTPYSLRYPEYATGADPKLDIQRLAEDVAPRLHRAEPLTGAQITAITSPRIGQLALNTDTGRVVFWNGTIWRPVGGLASGTASLGTVNLTTTYQTLSYFIGLGFEEVTAVIDPSPAQTTISSSNGGAVLMATTDPARAILWGIYNGTTPTFRGLTSATDVATITLRSSTGAITTLLRNLRLDTDGYLRFEVSTDTAATVSSSTHLNWRAR